MYRRSVPLLPLTINCFYILTLSYSQGYSGIQMYRRSVPLLPLTINCFYILTLSYPQG